MKLIFSLLILNSFTLQAREIVVINYNKEFKNDALLVKQALTHQLSLPEKFISLYERQCQDDDYAVATICVLDNGSVEVKQQKPNVMKRMLAAFGDSHVQFQQ